MQHCRAFRLCLLLVLAALPALAVVNTRKLDSLFQNLDDERDAGALNELEPLPLVFLETDSRVAECEQYLSQLFPAAATSFLELPTKEQILAEFNGRTPLRESPHQFVRFRAQGTVTDTTQSLQPPAQASAPTTGHTNVAVTVSRIDPITKKLVQFVPSSLPPPPPVDPRSFFRPLANPRPGFSCCKGLPCPYDRGVCCNSTAFCCPHMSECVETQNGQATCVEILPQPALKQKIVKIEVIGADGSHVANVQNGVVQGGNGIVTVEELARAQKDAIAQQTRLVLQQANFQRQQQQVEEMLQMAQRDEAAAEQKVHELTAKKNDAIDSIVAMITKAVSNLNTEEEHTIAAMNSSAAMAQASGNTTPDVVDMTPSPEQLAQFGQPWPPMAAVLNDGLGGTFVRQSNVDWTSNGLIRNGTYNVVTSQEDCKSQCESLEECRVAKFVQNTMQCWLDSDVAKTPSACPMVANQRSCVSYIKKVQRWDANYEYGVVAPVDSAFEVYDQQNRLGPGDASSGGRLLRNGRRNIVDNLTACITQCAQLKYCRSMVYFRPNGECWLSSTGGAAKPTRCARRSGRRDCISYVKKKVRPERTDGNPAMTTNNNGQTQTVSIENLGDTQTSTFSINLPTR